MQHLSKKITLLALVLALGFLAACESGGGGLGLPTKILTFTANPSEINEGEGATLTWNIFGGETTLDISVDGVESEEPLKRFDSFQVKPTETTTYTLSVDGETSEVVVTVNPREVETPTTPPPPTEPVPPENEPVAECGARDQAVEFEDEFLGQSVATALGVEVDELNCYNLTFLKNLPAQGAPSFASITSLEGLQFANNLEILNIGRNDVVDLSPIAELTKLTQIFAYSNNITDLSPLANLTNLNLLELSYNDVEDITPILGLPWSGTEDRVDLKEQRARTVIPEAQIEQLKEKVENVTSEYDDEGTPEEPTDPDPAPEPDPTNPTPAPNPTDPTDGGDAGTDTVGDDDAGTDTGEDTAGTDTAGTDTAGDDTAGTDGGEEDTAGDDTAGDDAGTDTVGDDDAGDDTGTDTAGDPVPPAPPT